MTAHQIVAKSRNLPQVSHAAVKLIELLKSANDDFDEAAACIKSDGLLAARLLRVCNSVAFGLADRVASVDQALLMLGFDEVRRLALTLSFGNNMAAAVPGYGIEPSGLWNHAFLSATAAEQLIADGVDDRGLAGVAFTAALLHDIGKIIMGPLLDAEARIAIRDRMDQHGQGSIEAERSVLGTDHAEVGACLLHVWRLPDEIVEAVGNHHRPPVRTAHLSAIAHVANRIAHLAAHGADSSRYAFDPNEAVLKAVGLDFGNVEELVKRVRAAGGRVRDLQVAA